MELHTEDYVVKEPRSRSIVMEPTEDYVVKELGQEDRHGVLQKILL